VLGLDLHAVAAAQAEDEAAIGELIGVSASFTHSTMPEGGRRR
jgi:hypothetical protein